MSRKKSGGVVFRTGEGRICAGCVRPKNDCVCADRARSSARSGGDGIVRLQRETKGRKGAGVTVVSGLALSDAELAKLAKEFKKKCGVGGAVKDDRIELQGDQRDRLKAELEAAGYTVKLSGG